MPCGAGDIVPRLADAAFRECVAPLLERGASWAEIGRAAGMTPSGALLRCRRLRLVRQPGPVRPGRWSAEQVAALVAEANREGLRAVADRNRASDAQLYRAFRRAGYVRGWVRRA